ncbi:MAG: hypothetical protein ACPGYV_08215 [Phycisphaeraceae bacterium]
MKTIRTLTASLALLALLVAMPAAAAQAPKEAVGTNTMLMVYVDVEAISPDSIASLGQLFNAVSNLGLLEEEGLGLPIGDPQDIVDGLTDTRASFVEAGGKGLLMTVDTPGDESWSPGMALFAKVSDDADAKAMAGLFGGPDETDRQATAQKLANNWHNIAINNADGSPVTQPLPEPDADALASFNKQFAEAGDPVFAVAFRMQDAMREKMDGAQDWTKDLGESQDNAQAKMAIGILMSMFTPIRSLDTVGMVVTQGEDGRVVELNMSFLDQTSAQQFSNLYNTVLMLAPLAVAEVAMKSQGQIENMPDLNTIAQFFNRLKMKAAGETLKLRLDEGFMDMAEKMRPLFEQMRPQEGDDLEL